MFWLSIAKCFIGFRTHCSLQPTLGDGEKVLAVL